LWTVGGAPKAIEVTRHLLEDALDGKVTIDGSSIYGMTTVDKSDLRLVPDLASFRRLPFYDSEFGNVAAIMCFVTNPDGTPAVGCVRSKLKHELDKMNVLGFCTMNVGLEPEFFILKAGDSSDNSAPVDCHGYADIDDDDRITRVRHELVYELGRCGIVPLTAHHERAPSQFEITFKYADAMRSCDNMVLYKIIAKHVVRKHGLDVTFDPKPFEGVNGNGLHTNISLGKDGKNAFASDGVLSPVAKHFLAGVMVNAKALTYITNPLEDSYKRFVKGCEAPVSVCWGNYNRSAMIRVPIASESAMRIELRNPDSTMNPYLGIAGVLRAGLDGIQRKLEPPAPVDFDAYSDATRKKIELLPATLSEARRCFKKSKLLYDLI